MQLSQKMSPAQGFIHKSISGVVSAVTVAATGFIVRRCSGHSSDFRARSEDSEQCELRQSHLGELQDRRQ